MHFVIAVVAALAGATPLPIDDGTVRGRITDTHTNAPIASAGVYMTGASASHFTLTNESGEYTFTDVPSGRYRLRVLHPGFETTELEFELGASPVIAVDVALRLKPVQVPGLRVAAERAIVATTRDDPEAKLSNWSAGGRWLGAGPHSASALSDMVAAKAAQPDADGRDAPHVLYIWGSNTEQGRVQLDGAALGAPLHLAGILPPIDPDLLSLAEYESGGAPPRYDGGTTHIMEFRTRSPADEPRAWGEIDALASRVGFDLPIGPGGVMIAGRRVNSEIIEWIAGQPLDYSYADVLTRSDLVSSARDRVHATAFATHEALIIPRDFTEDRASWRNLAFSAGWQRAGSAQTSLGIAWSRALADLPYLRAPDAHVVSTVDRAAINAAVRLDGDNTASMFGFDLERIHFGRRTDGIADAAFITGAGCRSDATCLDENMTTLAGHGEASWQPMPGLSLHGGLRLGYNAEHSRLDVLPRASVTRVLGEQLAVTLSAGRYSRATVLDSSTGGRDDAVIPLLDMDAAHSLTPTTVVATASHLQISLTRRTSRSSAGASAILRRHDGVPGSSVHTVPGFDLWWLYTTGLVDTSIGYSYLRRSGGSTDATDGLPDRHVLSAGIARSTGPAQFQLSAAWAVGLPFVALVIDDTGNSPVGPINDLPLDGIRSMPDDTYLRIDASATATWRVHWLDRDMAVTPYVKLINALDRRNAMFFFRDAGTEDGLRALAAVPIVPTLGFRWSF